MTTTTNGRTLFGGNGTQTLRGTDGADTIYGDKQSSGSFDLWSRDRDGAALSRDPGEISMTSLGGELHAYAAASGRGAGGAQAWSLSDTGGAGALRQVWSQDAMWYGAQEMLTGSQSLSAAIYGGQSYLVTAGLGVSLARIDASGAPRLIDSLDWDWGNGLSRPGAVAAYQAGGELRILAAGGDEGGLSVLRLRNGELELIQRTEEDGRLEVGEVSAMEIASLGAKRFAVIAARDQGSVTVWSLGASGPARLQLRSTGDGESRFDLADVEDLELVEIGGVSYIYAAAPGRTVAYRLTDAGGLVRVASTQGAMALETVEHEGRSLLFAADENLVRVYAIAASGRLDLIDTYNAGWGAEITDLAAGVRGDEVMLMAARADANGHDLIQYAEPGHDRIEAGAGDDLVRAGGGNDRIYGGHGHDRLDGGAGNDWIEGELGNDTLAGGEGNDALGGGDGHDRVYGAAGDDLVYGGAGDDDLIGESGRDTLHGGVGADKIDGGAGDDVITGGDGNDSILGRDGTDSIDGGTGHDRLAAGAGDDALSGGVGNDRLDGEDGNDALLGDAGDDVIDGGAGADQISGGEGNDTLLGGGGIDSIDGGAGDDRLSLEASQGGEMRGGAGTDRLLGGDGKDRMWGDADADFLFGARGADDAHGGAGGDALDGGAGRDRLWGEGGRDALLGGGGVDRIWGGRGHDDLDGGGGRDMLQGGRGRDDLDGGAGRDMLQGDGGRDSLAGGGGRDKLQGGGGRDSLDGGAGKDMLWGGKGADRFVFGDRDGRDRVMDFGGRDRLVFEDEAGFRALDISGRRGDAVIKHDGGVVILEDVDFRELDAGDFLFG